jgi:LysM repeat protein
MGAAPTAAARLDENRIPAQAALPGRASPALSATRERRMPLPPKTPFEKWKDTIDTSGKNPAWHSYDAVIKSTVDKYNTHLKSAPGFTALDWKLVKAMVWTETGAPSDSWATQPMQIGDVSDPGLAALLGGKEGGDLIMPSDIASSLTFQNVRTDPVKNIQAGVGYLLMKAANYDYVNVEDLTDPVHDYKVVPGDSLDRIARQNGSTLGELYWLNPGLHTLKIGQTVKIRKAKMMKTITGFKSLDNTTVARLYNSGDKRYAEKLAYCLGKIK